MDYKEKVIALLNSQELSKEQKEKLENIFPELKESEDDRIRKDIIRVFKGEIPFTSEKENEKYIVWIERQNKKLDPDKVIEWLKHCELHDWDIRTSIIPDSSPTSIPHRVRWLSDDFINKFKKDFEL